MSDVILRNRVFQLAKYDTLEATRVAERMSDPWYQCQAVAAIAAYSSSPEVEKALNRSFEIGLKCRDPFKRVASQAWPLSAAIKAGKSGKALTRLFSVLGGVDAIKDVGSRAEALLLLQHAIMPIGRKAYTPIVSALLTNCKSVAHWRQTRAMLDGVLLVYSISRDDGNRLIKALDCDYVADKIRRAIADGALPRRRVFFP
ncbi:MAG: hypothetical protein HS102_07780 [Planctomycetia bacterium]|nr:hypothetical protein [Planctomycetia bacterium]